MSSQTTRLPRLTQVALDHAAADNPVFPLHPYCRTPALDDWENWATTDTGLIISTWRQRPYNVAIATGPADLVVVDLDDAAAHGHLQLPPGAPSHGRHVLAQLAVEADAPYPADTFTVRTPRGGLHLYFRAPANQRLRNTQSRLGPLIDTRAHGGFIIAAGSVTRHGRYRSVNRAPAQELPPWLTDALTPPPRRKSPPVRIAAPDSSVYHQAALRGEADKVRSALPGLRRFTLLQAAGRMGRLLDLDNTTITTALCEASAQHLRDKAYTSRERDRAIADGIAWGRRHPRQIVHSSR